MDECIKFLDDRIRKICGLAPDFELTEEWLRNALDKIDLAATTTNSGGRLGGWRRGNKRLLTHKEAEERLQRARSIEF